MMRSNRSNSVFTVLYGLPVEMVTFFSMLVPNPMEPSNHLQAERLKEMGKWLDKYGYTIYGTRGGPFKPTDWGVSTRKGNKIYLHILKWSGDSPKIILPDIGMEIKKCILAGGGKVKFSKSKW